MPEFYCRALLIVAPGKRWKVKRETELNREHETLSNKMKQVHDAGAEII